MKSPRRHLTNGVKRIGLLSMKLFSLAGMRTTASPYFWKRVWDTVERVPTRLRNMLLTTRSALPVALVFFVAVIFSVSCSEKPENHKPGGTKQKVIPADPLMNEFISFQYAVYYLPVPTN